MMSPSIRDRLSDAQWLAHRYDPGHDAFHFRQVPRSRHAAIPFLTDEYLGEDAPLVLRRTDAIGQAPPAAPIHFVFHSRVLDESLRLLARPFTAGEATIVKPSNIVNPLIPAIMAMRPEARALLLHAPLDAYLASIARKGMWGRLWVRDLFGKLLREGMLASLGIAPDDYLGLTDIQVAAAGWLAQQQQFQLVTERLGPRVATLDSEMLVDRPAETMAALATLFGLRLDDDAIAAIVAGPIFMRDAKSGQAFAPGQRAAEARSGLEIHSEEVAKVAQWASVIADNAGIAFSLPRPLLD